MTALVSQPDVEAAMLRPLTTVEAAYIATLITQAENALRTKLPTLDTRMAAFAVDATDPTGINPVSVTRVLAGVLRRKLNNPQGAASTTNSRTDGPFSTSVTTSYAFRGQSFEDGKPGELEITDADLAALVAKPDGLPSTVHVRPPMTPGLDNNCAPDAAYLPGSAAWQWARW